MFARVGEIVYPAKAASADAMLEAVIDAGGENVDSGAEIHEITTSVEDFGRVRDTLEKEIRRAGKRQAGMETTNAAPVSGEAAENILKLIDALEDNDDVQNVTCNFEIEEAELARITGT